MRTYNPEKDKKKPFKCPCENCILLPTCKNKETVFCEDLYLFLCNINPIGILKFSGYKQGHGILVTKLFKKYITATLYEDFQIDFSTWSAKKSPVCELYRLPGQKPWEPKEEDIK
jgi:hypothetical protein